MEYKHISLPFLCLLFSLHLSAQCPGSGSIDSHFSSCTFLDPNQDGSIVFGGTSFSACSDELVEFESILNPNGNANCQVPWTAFGTEEGDDELWKGKGGKATDIISDENGGSDFAYFSIVDTDGLCDSGDEIIAFRLRIANELSGNTGFSFFISNDGLVGADDPDGIICNNKAINPGFEYEIQLSTNGYNRGISVYDIDGLAGQENCSGRTPCAFYSLASHVQKATACGSISACRAALPAGNPIFISFYLPLDDLNISADHFDLLSIVPTTNTTGNCTGVCSSQIADIGGVGDKKNIEWDCSDCASPRYEGCNKNMSKLSCALICAAERNTLSRSLPVELSDFKGKVEGEMNMLSWKTLSEQNTEWFVVERSDRASGGWKELHRKAAQGHSTQAIHYFFIDDHPLPTTYYRLRVIDFDGSQQFSAIIALTQVHASLSIESLYPNPATEWVHLKTQSPNEQSAILRLLNIKGQLVMEKQLDIPKGSHQLSVDISTLPSGIYSMQISGILKPSVLSLVKL